MEALVPPGISFLALTVLLVAARFFEMLPIQSAPCGLRTLTGIPCLACGGTRSLMALSRGEIVEAAAFNPLVFLGAVAITVWLAVVLWRMARGLPARRRARWSRARVVLVVTGSIALAAANWAYLIRYLPE
jgi:hypothetical protein